MTLRKPRWAAPADNDALIALNRACPMHGAIDMIFDRAPDYFALSRLQGEGAHVCVVDGEAAGHLDAAAAVASLPRVFVDGTPREVFYACDLRVHPGVRGGRTVKRIYDFMTAYGVEERGWDLGITTIMKDNAAMAPVLAGKAGLLPYHHAGTVRNHTVQFLLPKRRVPGVATRVATEADIPAMVALWNRVQAAKQFAPEWTEDGLRAFLATAPDVGIGGYRLAFRGDRLVALLLTWDQEAFKRMVVLGYAPEMVRMRRWYNPLARVLGLARIPEVGGALPYLYATHLCAEGAEDLRALYVDVYNAHRTRGHLFFSTLLDVRDPLAAALDGFLTQHVDIELYVMDPRQRWAGHPFGARPIYFDPAIV